MDSGDPTRFGRLNIMSSSWPRSRIPSSEDTSSCIKRDRYSRDKDGREVDSAAEYYRQAPAVPDAHFNLARISELKGDEVSALRHMREYRQLLEME